MLRYRFQEKVFKNDISRNAKVSFSGKFLQLRYQPEGQGIEKLKKSSFPISSVIKGIEIKESTSYSIPAKRLLNGDFIPNRELLPSRDNFQR